MFVRATGNVQLALPATTAIGEARRFFRCGTAPRTKCRARSKASGKSISLPSCKSESEIAGAGSASVLQS